MSADKNLGAAALVTEAQMREAGTPRPTTQDELHAYIEELVKREHDYGTCVYAMSLAATAAFHYVAHKLGVTGFQASCADLDILRRTRGYKGPFAVIDGNDMLYPQYDTQAKVADMLGEWRPWAADEAKRLLASTPGDHIAPAVLAHWQQLAEAA